MTKNNTTWDARRPADVAEAVVELAEMDAAEGDHEATSRRLRGLAECVRAASRRAA